MDKLRDPYLQKVGVRTTYYPPVLRVAPPVLCISLFLLFTRVETSQTVQYRIRSNIEFKSIAVEELIF